MSGILKTACDRCGTCCRQGGPALHTGDRHLIELGVLGFEDLITVRRGELAFQPLADSPTPVAREFIKIQGQGSDWCCKFYDGNARECTIYENRPLACGLLDCTAPDALLAITGKDLLNRFDCIPGNDPLLPLVHLHERECPCPELDKVTDDLRSDDSRAETLQDLTVRTRVDLGIRNRAVHQCGLSVAGELFYFGRPLFQLLIPLGVRISESAQGLVLHYENE